MRRSILTAAALVVVAGCGGAGSSSLQAASHQEASSTTRSSVVTTTTRPSVKTKVAPPKVAPKVAPAALAPTTVPHRSRAIARAVVAVAPAPPVTRPPTPAPPVPTAGATSSAAEAALVAAINNFRSAHGLSILATHPELVRKAQSWALHMANGGCGRGGNGLPNICHSVLSDGITVQWTALAENVGMISPSTNVMGMHNAFVNSPAHAANMLNGTMTYVGVGIATVGNYMYAAEVFMAV
jgi:uncharacterized protein YkwD